MYVYIYMYMNTYIIHMNTYINIYENCQRLGSQKHGPTGRGSGLLVSVSLEYSEKFLKKEIPISSPPLKTPVNHRCYIDTAYSQKTFPFSSPENSKP